MYRVLVALLCALDAAVAAAAGLALVAAPLTVLWVFGFGGAADWAALWPATAATWQLGHLVPLQITLPDELLARGIAADAATFALSLAPLALTLLTAGIGVRSGARAARAGAWLTGAGAALVAMATASAFVAITSATPVASPELWRAVLQPAAIYASAVVAGGVFAAWREGDDGIVDALRDALERAGGSGAEVAVTALRGASIALVALIGFGALAVGIAVFARAGEMIALFQAGNADGVGATILTLGQLAYLPTLVIWGMAWVTGPGFAVGAGTAVSPAGTELGVVPAVPVLGAIPDLQTPWLLLVVLLPIAAGAFAGWVARSDLVSLAAASRMPGAVRRTDGADRPGSRLAVALAIGAVTAAGTWLFGVAASGSLGPGSLAEVGPHAGWLALAAGGEVLLGAAILLLAPLRAGDALALRVMDARRERPPHGHDALIRAERWGRAHEEPDRWHHLDETREIEPLPADAGAGEPAAPSDAGAGEPAAPSDADDTAPIEPLPPRPGPPGPAD